MSKSMSKGEKLDVLIEEMSKIKGGLKTLLKQHASLADAIKRLGKTGAKAVEKSSPRKRRSAKPAAPAAAVSAKRKAPVVLRMAPPPADKNAG